MSWLTALLGERKRIRRPTAQSLRFERLEARTLPTASGMIAGTTLTITGNAATNDNIQVSLDASGRNLLLVDTGRIIQSFSSAGVTQINVNGGTADNIIRIDMNVFQPATITAGNGNNRVYAGSGDTTITVGNGNNVLYGGAGTDVLNSGSGDDRLFAAQGFTTFNPGTGHNLLFGVKNTDVVTNSPGAQNQVLPNLSPPAVQLAASDVTALLHRAAAASAADNAIIAVVDRGGRILGVRVEGGVSPDITANNTMLTFAIDGAVAEARTAAMFANDQAPLTSRTVEFISQTTLTQAEINSNPDLPPLTGNFNDPAVGPGYVAPIGVKSHFPPNVPNTPQVDLFEIEGSNRDSLEHTPLDGIRALIGPNPVTDDIPLNGRFNSGVPLFPTATTAFTPPESYGYNEFPTTDPAHFAQSRGIGTLPGGIPIYKDGQEVGGIGVFFPGTTGYASEENSALSVDYNPAKIDLSEEAEYMAFVAVGGSPAGGASFTGAVGGTALPSGIAGDPSGRIDLVGITLDIFGPGGTRGTANLLAFGSQVGTSSGTSSILGPDVNQPLAQNNIDLLPGGGGGSTSATALDGLGTPDGYIVPPQNAVAPGPVTLTAQDVNQIIAQGIVQAEVTRAAIRLPLGTRAQFAFVVVDTQGNIIGLYRQDDSTTFSIDVATAKARNVAYYANPSELQPSDEVAGVPAGAALTSRTFRYLAQPRYPEGVDGAPPGPFSVLQDGNVNDLTGLNLGPQAPAGAYNAATNTWNAHNSAQGFNDFHAGFNFHESFGPTGNATAASIANQNGVVFFPGAVPLYKVDPATGQRVLVGGLGVSGDGVDQDDVTTAAAAAGFEPPPNLRADMYSFAGVQLPYQKYNRNPDG